MWKEKYNLNRTWGCGLD